jgi:hypothetical protein
MHLNQMDLIYATNPNLIDWFFSVLVLIKALAPDEILLIRNQFPIIRHPLGSSEANKRC